MYDYNFLLHLSSTRSGAVGLGLDLELLALASSIWLRLTSLEIA